MTAQPEVVWVYPEPGGYWGVADEPVPAGTAYVSQSSLTAALAERDKARGVIAAVKSCLDRSASTQAYSIIEEFLTAQAAQGDGT